MHPSCKQNPTECVKVWTDVAMKLFGQTHKSKGSVLCLHSWRRDKKKGGGGRNSNFHPHNQTCFLTGRPTGEHSGTALIPLLYCKHLTYPFRQRCTYIFNLLHLNPRLELA